MRLEVWLSRKQSSERCRENVQSRVQGRTISVREFLEILLLSALCHTFFLLGQKLSLAVYLCVWHLKMQKTFSEMLFISFIWLLILMVRNKHLKNDRNIDFMVRTPHRYQWTNFMHRLYQKRYMWNYLRKQNVSRLVKLFWLVNCCFVKFYFQ